MQIWIHVKTWTPTNQPTKPRATTSHQQHICLMKLKVLLSEMHAFSKFTGRSKYSLEMYRERKRENTRGTVSLPQPAHLLLLRLCDELLDQFFA